MPFTSRTGQKAHKGLDAGVCADIIRLFLLNLLYLHALGILSPPRLKEPFGASCIRHGVEPIASAELVLHEHVLKC